MNYQEETQFQKLVPLTNFGDKIIRVLPSFLQLSSYETTQTKSVK